MALIPSNPDKLNHNVYTYRDQELARVLNNIWNNKLFITDEDLKILNNFSTVCKGIEVYYRRECDNLITSYDFEKDKELNNLIKDTVIDINLDLAKETNFKLK